MRPPVSTVDAESSGSGNFAPLDHASHPQRIARTSATADNTDLFPSTNGNPTGVKAVEVPVASQTVSAKRSVSDRRRMPLIVGSLALGWAVLYLDRSILFPLLPVIGDEFDLSGAQRGAITSAYFVAYVAMQMPSGLLGDRLGLKRVVVGMYLLIGVALVGIGIFSISYVLLVAFVALQGFGAGAFYSGSYGITLSSVPAEHRGASSAVVTSGMALGSAMGLALAGAAYSLTDSWRMPYLFMLAPTLLTAGVMALLIRGVPPPPRVPGGLSFLVSNRSFLTLGVANFCGLYGYMVIFTWGPSFLVERHGLSVTRSGVYVALVALTSLAGALAWGRMSDRLGRKRLTLWMFCASAVLLWLVPQFDSTRLALATLGLYGFFGALAWNPILVAWAGDVTVSSGRVGMGTAMGAMNTVGISSAFVAPLVSGWISDLAGSLAWAFYVGAIAAFVGVVAALATGEGSQASPAQGAA